MRLKIAEVIASPHTYAEMVMARIMVIAAGYEDANYLDALRNDPPMIA